MSMREAACACGQLRAFARGEPVRVSVCHCLDCQRRTGSVFAAQARFPAPAVRVEGAFREFSRRGDDGATIVFRFCPQCGSTVCYQLDDEPGLVAIPVGAFADPGFPPPRVEVYAHRRHAWVRLPEDTRPED